MIMIIINELSIVLRCKFFLPYPIRNEITAIPQEGFAWSGKTGWC